MTTFRQCDPVVPPIPTIFAPYPGSIHYISDVTGKEYEVSVHEEYCLCGKALESSCERTNVVFLTVKDWNDQIDLLIKKVNELRL